MNRRRAAHPLAPREQLAAAQQIPQRLDARIAAAARPPARMPRSRRAAIRGASPCAGAGVGGRHRRGRGRWRRGGWLWLFGHRNVPPRWTRPVGQECAATSPCRTAWWRPAESIGRGAGPRDRCARRDQAGARSGPVSTIRTGWPTDLMSAPSRIVMSSQSPACSSSIRRGGMEHLDRETDPSCSARGAAPTGTARRSHPDSPWRPRRAPAGCRWLSGARKSRPRLRG